MGNGVLGWWGTAEMGNGVMGYWGNKVMGKWVDGKMKDGNSLADYLHFLNIAQSSLGELGSGIDACHLARQLGCDKFNELIRLHYEVENKLLKLIESLQKKSIDET